MNFKPILISETIISRERERERDVEEARGY